MPFDMMFLSLIDAILALTATRARRTLMKTIRVGAGFRRVGAGFRRVGAGFRRVGAGFRR